MKAATDSAILGPVVHAEPGVALDELIRALQRKGVPLPFEIGTFLVLDVCEQIMRAPGRVIAADIRLDDEGQVLVSCGVGASDSEACRGLVELLGELLVRSAPGVPPALLRLVETGPTDGSWTLARLRDDLEASLVPLNRAATRRVLARAVREGRREDERAPKRVSSPPTEGEVDAELDGVLGGVRDDRRSSGEREIATSGATGHGARRVETRGGHGAARASPERPIPPDAGASGPVRGSAGLDEFERVASSQGRTGVLVGIVVAALCVAIVATYLILAR